MDSVKERHLNPKGQLLRRPVQLEDFSHKINVKMQSLVTFKVREAKVSNATHFLNVEIQPMEQEYILIFCP